MEPIDPSKDITSELESFREQWRKEVQSRKATASEAQKQDDPAESSKSGQRPPRPGPDRPSHLGPGKPVAPDFDEDYTQPRAFDDPATSQPTTEAPSGTENEREPVTALDHYEKAVERENLGSLGDSLALYRKAFRMDHKVEQKYKNKHYAAAWAANPAQTSQPPRGADTKDAVQAPTVNKPLTIQELIASFSGLSIEPAPPIIVNTPAPPCPIASLPDEILIHVLREVAIQDVADYVRLARVCKRFAWLVATEDRIWRRICLGTEFGFAAMHYRWKTSVSWGPLTEDRLLAEDPEEVNRLQEAEALATTSLLLNTAYQSSWQHMFRRRSRVRFNGCYISTINYIRAGQTVNSLIFGASPVHIVTYYRYLRFYRDGTAVTLCTVEEPAAVVHHMSKDVMKQHKGGAMAHLSSAVMQHATRGRWRLSSAVDSPEAKPEDSEGDLFVESDGGGNYIYRMELSMRSAGKAARNNKLTWKGFYNLNKTTQEWDEFSLKNDKPFFFSRVKSYGFGG